nr:type IV pilus modification protein PilV [Permianibacter aggregans]
MIEVLIAVLVLAIGLLGVAALQMSSMKSGMEGYFRSQATALAEDLASRVRASREIAKSDNPPWVKPIWGKDHTELIDDGDPDTEPVLDTTKASPLAATAAFMNYFVSMGENTDGDDIAVAFACADAPPGGTYCRAHNGNDASACNFQQSSAFDVWEMCTLADEMLPEGKVFGKINGTRLTIAVSWQVSELDKTVETEKVNNPLCAQEFETISENEDCVLLEVVP